MTDGFNCSGGRDRDYLTCEDLERFITRQHYGNDDHDKMEAEIRGITTLIQKYAQSCENSTQEGNQ